MRVATLLNFFRRGLDGVAARGDNLLRAAVHVRWPRNVMRLERVSRQKPKFVPDARHLLVDLPSRHTPTEKAHCREIAPVAKIISAPHNIGVERLLSQLRPCQCMMLLRATRRNLCEAGRNVQRLEGD